MNVVILAAGQGKRMGSDRPKVLHALAGRPLLGHVIDTARALQPQHIVVVYGHGGEQVKEAMQAPGLVFVRQEPQLGTGHALLQALPHLDPSMPTVVLYGDVPLITVQTLQGLVRAAGPGLALLSAELDDPQGYGRVLRDQNGYVDSIVEERDADDAQRAMREVNTGFMVLPTAELASWLGQLSNRNAQGEYYLTDAVAVARRAGVPVAALTVHDVRETLGVNSKKQLAQVERIYQGRYADRLMEQGASLRDPARIDVRGTLTCGRDVQIDVNCVFEGDVTLEQGADIGPHCVLKNAHVGAYTRLEAYTHIDGAHIGARCRIGPYARLRPGTALAEDVHIGNFVEVKASTIAAGSKANHLAYVGDSTVGRNVNVGAGTITCNYDGANKHRTIIEDDVFIGSDTQLVAPVTVRRGATIGAGSTITREAPPEQLTLTRVKQVSVATWKRPVKKGTS
ncbi:MAG TPA: bifunctional UDP-N-acetylglucosamine diphosphorylase/glucosamine-1-phosphate N-acetyltransferase GlmU [Burkholderiales bacterium]